MSGSMDAIQVLSEAITNIRGLVTATVRDLDPEALAWRPRPDANSIAWLVWHLTRIQDDHVADIGGREQTWSAGDWAVRFGLPAGATDTGYGHSPDEVAAVRARADLLIAYHDAVSDATLTTLGALSPSDLDSIVDRSYDPPVTAGVRLVSVVTDDLQHLGQAAYVRGLLP